MFQYKLVPTAPNLKSLMVLQTACYVIKNHQIYQSEQNDTFFFSSHDFGVNLTVSLINIFQEFSRA